MSTQINPSSAWDLLTRLPPMMLSFEEMSDRLSETASTSAGSRRRHLFIMRSQAVSPNRMPILTLNSDLEVQLQELRAKVKKVLKMSKDRGALRARLQRKGRRGCPPPRRGGATPCRDGHWRVVKEDRGVGSGNGYETYGYHQPQASAVRACCCSYVRRRHDDISVSSSRTSFNPASSFFIVSTTKALAISWKRQCSHAR